MSRVHSQCIPFFWQKAAFWISVIRSGSNSANNYRARRVGGGLVIYATHELAYCKIHVIRVLLRKDRAKITKTSAKKLVNSRDLDRRTFEYEAETFLTITPERSF